jgi:hypothetical protein
LSRSVSSGRPCMDIPSSSDQPNPIGPDPKTWKGSWTSITQPDKIASNIYTTNCHQYSQAQETPFGSDTLIPLFGCKADQQAIHQLSSLPTSLLPETLIILNKLSTPFTIPLLSHKRSNSMSPEQFTSLYQSLNEATSTLPSVGTLTELQSTKVSFSNTVGFSPEL